MEKTSDRLKWDIEDAASELAYKEGVEEAKKQLRRAEEVVEEY